MGRLYIIQGLTYRTLELENGQSVVVLPETDSNPVHIQAILEYEANLFKNDLPV